MNNFFKIRNSSFPLYFKELDIRIIASSYRIFEKCNAVCVCVYLCASILHFHGYLNNEKIHWFILLNCKSHRGTNKFLKT